MDKQQGIYVSEHCSREMILTRYQALQDNGNKQMVSLERTNKNWISVSMDRGTLSLLYLRIPKQVMFYATSESLF